MGDTLREDLWQAFLVSPPPELQGSSIGVKEQYFDEIYQRLAGDRPLTFEFSESSLPSDVLAMLERIRQTIDYFQFAYQALIGFMLLLALGIILISQRVTPITRHLGIPCLTYGTFGSTASFVAKRFSGTWLPLPETLDSLQTWMLQLINNVLAPMEVFSLGLLIGGLVLTVASFVYKPRQTSS